VLLAILDDSVAKDLLSSAGFCWSSASTEPAQYLHDYGDDELGNVLALARSKLRRSCPGDHSQNGEEVPSSYGDAKRRRVEDDGAAEARALVNRLEQLWEPFSTAVRGRFNGWETSLVGMLLLHGGSAALPVVDELLAAGYKLQPDSAGAAGPLLIPVVDHFICRCWIEKQLRLPNAKAVEAFRRVLLWLAEKTADKLQINWEPW
jgi:hypothetical protein